ncbi:hypothetical protein CAPTEDRAFT_226991 [Capitella teleta]|uniref:Tropomodulin n=1 Tax=Capitella teleta TaxID=283909 RepID=R7VFZ5_CAPTE|nr:hypothetical protein CAPTEDRAFT_226991 [Capitella teleta]|eukprot:ELU14605.1 hypothetical protein CAPTEDRAFT_226991 [Capitella teleta]
MATKLYGKDASKYDDIDLDELLSKLTEEELVELETDLIDPDDSCIPPSQRCRYKTDKKPSGPFNRKQLLDFLIDKAKNEADWDEAKPYEKVIRGKVWKAKEEDDIQIHEDAETATEWDEVLRGATEEELVDLAAILGFHGMLNQVQYHQAFVSGERDVQTGDTADTPSGAAGTGFRGVAKHQDFKLFEGEPPNTTDVDAALKQLQANDPELKELNLNNIKVNAKSISIDSLCEIAKALKGNCHLEKLHMANTRATEKVAKALAESLKDNKTLKVLNLESNYISGPGFISLLQAINEQQVLHTLKVANQKPSLLGNRIEMHLAELVRQNKSLLNFGIFLEVPAAKIAMREYLQRNNDNVRRQRVGMEQIELPAPREPKWLIRENAEKDVASAALAGTLHSQQPKTEESINDVKEEEDEESEEESEDEEDSDEKFNISLFL